MALTESPTTDNRFVTWTNWEGYLKFVDALQDRRIKITYDRGTLELMSPSPLHERTKKVIGALLECLLEELGTDFQGGGSTTFRRMALDRAMEPDECYWIRRLSEALSIEDVPYEEAPAPDLAVEVEVTRSSLNRLGIYGAMGVPEVWRWITDAGGRLQIHVMIQPGQYDASPTSPTFPGLEPAEFERWVRLGVKQGQSRAVRQFRAWIESHRDTFK